jgi:hypothetical protein
VRRWAMLHCAFHVEHCRSTAYNASHRQNVTTGTENVGPHS